MANDRATVVTTIDDQDIAGQAMDAFRKEGFDGADLKILEGNSDTLMNELTGHGFIAAALNARGVPTARGGRWQVSNVRNVLRRHRG